ncbi:hypothetical protein [Algoriphagus yeomjeoni]|uniref:Uncharacterized protein n=1 Tax=Algoriphagus yeomjeoni TaxID=291403 RepID=A0A327PK25_9BACT|nr:hypothetical protein [Algoriphagus yeomjeoni]RAI91923.1 hypothetical protein LV83_01148 [Algoriphagus yeomjeoni]
MKSYKPKPDLWGKIQQRKDFDSQVKEHAPNLPVKMPKPDLWEAIEGKLDQKKPVIPLWKYGMVAASIALILALSSIAYLKLGRKDVVSPLTTEVTVKTPELHINAKTEPAEIKSAEEPPTRIEAKESITNLPEQKVTNRILPGTIQLPTLELPEIGIETRLISEVIIPPTPDKSKPQTLHKVRISWGMQEKTKLQTKFGSSTPEDISTGQLGLANQPKNSIKINFHKQ